MSHAIPDLHPVTFIFVRHGESTWNAERRVQGQTDVPLSDRGRAQAGAAAALIAGHPVGAVFASPLQRARHTAEIINETLDLPMTTLDALMEVRLGELEGKPYPAGLSDWEAGNAPDGAETQDEFFARALSGINQVLKSWTMPDTHPLIVAHGGVFRAVQHHALRDHSWPVENCRPVLVTPPEEDDWPWTMEEL
ncbi:MAG: histidine phosphatase family protein [Pseudomonadota bacterium]